ncbi:MAG: serine/threonine-protein kinase [Thermoanaerobaculia bacterium]|nr:serine/threonine-protein kinase [Thermoanaerobaculia bacterium]
MTITDFERVDRILRRALEYEGERRERWIRRATRGEPDLEVRVRKLLEAANDDGGFAPGGAHELASGRLGETGSELGALTAGDRVGKYRILGTLGRGGMATVYLAERADGEFEHQVALKLLDPAPFDEESRRRFHDERRILARFRHPHVAQIHDGGLARDGRPFFVLEWVDGLPLDEHCSQQGLGLEQRLRLILQVLDALGEAHRQLVVHRDLKPSNLLVTADGRVKMLDFGIAKILQDVESTVDRQQAHATTRFLRVLTPQYASPEQVRGEAISTATDIYQVGGLLYLLLAGRTPHDLSGSTPADVERIVCAEVPPPPSEVASTAWRRRLTGDLDAIVMKALRKEPRMRYESAAELAADLEAYLDRRPVSARRGATWYRMRRWVRRHAVLTTLLVLLGVYALTVTWLGWRFDKERRAAEASASLAIASSNFLQDLFRDADPYRAGRGDLTVRDLLDRAQERADRQFAAEPLTAAAVQGLIARALLNLGDRGAAAESLSRVDALLERGADGFGTELIRFDALATAAVLAQHESRLSEAGELIDRADALFEQLPQAHRTREGRARILRLRGRGADLAGRHADAVEIFRNAEEISAGGARPDWDRVLLARHDRVLAMIRGGMNLDQAVELATESIELHQRHLGEDHPMLVHHLVLAGRGYGSLAWRADPARSEERASGFERGLELLEAAATAASRHFDPSSPVVAEIEFLRGGFAYSNGALDDALEYYKGAYRAHSGRESFASDAAASAKWVGLTYLALEQPEKALQYIQQAVDIRLQIVDGKDYRLAQARATLAQVYHRLGRLDSAIEELRLAVDTFQDELSDHKLRVPLTEFLVTTLLDRIEADLDGGLMGRETHVLVDEARTLLGRLPSDGAASAGAETQKARLAQLERALEELP